MSAASGVSSAPPNSDLTPTDAPDPAPPILRALLLKNQIQNAESEVEFARRHSRAIFAEAEQLLRASEIVAFDMGLASYILKRRERDYLAYFLDVCQRFRFEFRDGRDIGKAVKRAVDHVRFVHGEIAGLASLLQSCEWDQADFSHKDVMYLMDQRKMRGGEEPEPPKEAKPKNLSFRVSQKAQQRAATGAIGRKIEEMIQADASESTNESADARAWLGRVSFRIQTANELKREIQKVKDLTPQPRHLTARGYSRNAIQNSQFFRDVAGDAALLQCAYSSVHRQRRLLNACREAFRGASAQLAELKKKADDTRGRVTVHLGSLKNDMKKPSREVEKLTASLMPIYEVLMPDEVNERMQEGIKKIEEIEKEIEAILSNNKSPEAEDSLAGFNDQRESRAQMIEKCTKAMDARRACAVLQRQLFSMVSEALGQDERNRLVNRESGVQAKYREALADVATLMDKGTSTRWCRSMKDVLQETDSAMTALRENVAEMAELENVDYEKHIQDLEKELNDLQEEAGALSLRKAELDVQLMQAKENVFTQFQRNMIYKRWIPWAAGGRADQLRERELRRLEEGIKCRVCKERYCNECLPDCQHPLCSECAIECGGKCPFCGSQFKEKHAVKFLYKP